MKKHLLPVIAVGIALASCLPDGSTGRTLPEPDPIASTTTIAAGRVLEVVGCEDAPEEAEILCQTYELIHTSYVDEVDDTKLADAAALGLRLLDGADTDSALTCVAPAREFVETCSVAAEAADDITEAAEAMVRGVANFGLDPNSAYLDPEALALVEEEQGGEVEGIGALVSAEDDSSGEAEQCGVVSDTCQLVIVSTLIGSPAEQAGLMPGDVIAGVQGERIEGWTVDEVTAAVRGPAGTDVDLTIERDGVAFEVTITRAAIEIPVVSHELVGRAGYVRLNQFTENADEQLRETIFDFLSENIDTLVVDLRDNPGGLLTTAIDVASLFLPDGEVVETMSPDKVEKYDVSGNPIVPEDLEVVFVVNRGSASASELVSAVLQERGRALVVGENTFGKNTVQQRFNLVNGGALKLTIARWVTPGGLDFGGVGVTPDVEIEFDPTMTATAVVEAALRAS